MPEQPKSCATCRFMSKERPQPGMIEPIMMCRYGSLVPVLTPTTAGVTIRALCPAVAPTDWCHRYESLPPITN